MSAERKFIGGAEVAVGGFLLFDVLRSLVGGGFSLKVALEALFGVGFAVDGANRIKRKD